MKAHFVFSVLLFTFPVYLVSSSFEVVSCFCACWQPILCQQTFKKKQNISNECPNPSRVCQVGHRHPNLTPKPAAVS
jgi:hypothetical protein